MPLGAVGCAAEWVGEISRANPYDQRRTIVFSSRREAMAWAEKVSQTFGECMAFDLVRVEEITNTFLTTWAGER
jgi:hypothetical protein